MPVWLVISVQILLWLKSFLAQEAPTLTQLQLLVHPAHWDGNVHLLMDMGIQNVFQ